MQFFEFSIWHLAMCTALISFGVPQTAGLRLSHAAGLTV